MGYADDLDLLLVEDNRIMQRVCVIAFAQLGLSIDIASNGREACEMYRKKNYDLILMDLEMPVMDGIEATRQIRALEKESNSGTHIKIVALSGNMVSEKKVECIQAGMDGFIEKPFRKEDLISLLNRLYN